MEMSQLVVTPHPILLDGQRHITGDLRVGESLYCFLQRHVDNLDGQAWEVSIGGRVVERHLWHHTYPKDGQIIEVRGAVGRNVLYIIAFAVLTYFTFGVGTLFNLSTVAGYAAATVTFVAGAMLINKTLGPKLEKSERQTPDTVYNLGSPRNRARPYEPLGLLFGSVKIAPDVISQPYAWYQGNDQYLAMVLSPGINVDRIEPMQNGDTPLASYEGVSIYHSGYPGLGEQNIPVYTNADTIPGGTLEKTGEWVERTTSTDTMRIHVNVEYQLYDNDSKGRPYFNHETVIVNWKPVGTNNWTGGTSRAYHSNEPTVRRDTIDIQVPRGQYDVRVRRIGQAWEEQNGNATFSFVTMTSIQADTATYKGFSRTAVVMKATGQLSGTPDEFNTVAHARSIPVWNGSAWVTATTRATGLSNPGAQILQYARGIYDEDGHKVGGIGLDDGQIDMDAFKGFMLHCAANGYTYDNWITDVRSHNDVCNSIALAGFGQITWAGGRLSVSWAADEQPFSGVVNMANIQAGKFQVDYTLANAADGIEYTYFDRETWQPATLRVPAPGVTTMLNPAQLTGEGVTTEAHAAELARYHLAQSLYQYKDISYSTDIEHLSYRRLSMLALQHDLTQWGFGGRVLAASRSPTGVVTLTLDDKVPKPAAGNAFIGLRIPGEDVYRIFTVLPFAGTETNTIVLSGAWPDDAALPGNTDANPAHDTIWIYDFKQTPGYRVRVVGIEPENDLAGAGVTVVPEPPEFWTYVKTGEYIPPSNDSLLQTKPVASNLVVTEQQIPQGNTIVTELSVTFDVSGRVGTTYVSAALGDGEIKRVAETTTRTATWRIREAGTYTIVVRPYSPDGEPGVAATIVYITVNAEDPPWLYDWFQVNELSGGIRQYSFGFNETSNVPANLAGAEIRYIAGTTQTPVWADMIAIGDAGGFHTAAFEAVVPPAGDWTFACRARNTSGVLSEGMLVLNRTLTKNLGEVIDGITDQQALTDAELLQITQDLFEADQARQQETIDRIMADANNILLQAEDASERVAIQAAITADQLLNEKLEREAAINNIEQIHQSDTNSLALQISSLSAGSGTQFDSERIWYFDQSDENWTSSQGAPTVNDGFLRPADGSPSFAMSPAGLGVDGTAYRYVKIRVRKVGNPTWYGQLWWRAPTDATFDVARSATATEPLFDGNGMATLDWSDIPWAGITVDQIQIAPGTVQSATDYFEIDWVAIGRPTPGASVAMVQDLEQAMTDADSAEALARSTLAAQIRGNYTGNDLASLTQGLLYQERFLRVQQDNVLANRATVLEGKINDPVTGLDAKANITYVDTIEVRVEDVEGTVTTHTQQIGSAVASIADKADASALDATNLKVTQQGDQITSNSNRVGALEASVNNPASGLATKASSSALAATNVKVQSNADAITVEGDRIDSLTQTVAGKASSTQVNLLTGRVDVIENEVEAQGQSITQLRAEVGGGFQAGLMWQFIAANEQGWHGWSFQGGNAASFPVTSNYGAMALQATTVDPRLYSPPLNISGKYNQRVRALVRRRTDSVWQGSLYWSTASHGESSTYSVQTAAPPVGQWTEVEWVLDAQADWTGNEITRIRLDFAGNSATETNSVVDVRWIGIGTIQGPSASAEAASSMLVKAGPNGAYAQATVMTDVNGRIAGTRLTNDGNESEFIVLADKFGIVDAGGDGSAIYTDGRWIVSSGGWMEVRGKPFGQNNEMIMWYGPAQGNLANCLRSNAYAYKTRNGLLFQKGGFIGGTRVTSGFNPSLALAPIFNTGPFGTGGNPIGVNATYAYYKQHTTNSINGRFTAGSGVTRALMSLYRKVGTGALQLVAQQWAAGELTIIRTGDTSDRALWNINGAINYIDNQGGTANREYELRITQRTLQIATHNGSGSILIPAEDQATGITTAE